MSAEFHVKFMDSEWFDKNRGQIAAKIKSLPSFAREETQDEYWLSGAEPHIEHDSLPLDVRLWLRGDRIDIDISASSPTAYADLAAIISRLRHNTAIEVLDDDDLPSGW